MQRYIDLQQIIATVSRVLAVEKQDKPHVSRFLKSGQYYIYIISIQEIITTGGNGIRLLNLFHQVDARRAQSYHSRTFFRIVRKTDTVMHLYIPVHFFRHWIKIDRTLYISPNVRVMTVNSSEERNAGNFLQTSCQSAIAVFI